MLEVELDTGGDIRLSLDAPSGEVVSVLLTPELLNAVVAMLLQAALEAGKQERFADATGQSHPPMLSGEPLEIALRGDAWTVDHVFGRSRVSLAIPSRWAAALLALKPDA